MKSAIYFADLYRRYLSKYFIFRLLKEAAVTILRFHRRLKSSSKCISQSGCYSLIALSSFAKNSSVKKTIIAAEEETHIPAPFFSGYFSGRATKKNSRIIINFPRLEIFEIPSAMVVGKLDIVFSNQFAIHHDLFDVRKHQTPSENIGVTSINRRRNRINLYLTAKPSHIKKAVSLIGQCSGNYAHWLTETLPKLAILDSCEKYSDFPILVESNLHPNIYSSLDLINKNHREVIMIDPWSSICVEQLILVSQPGYERYSPHNLYSKEPPPYINKFSRKALHILKNTIDSVIELEPDQENDVIYLARSQKSGNIRHIENISEIESLIAEKGIKKITSDSMSFLDQVIACASAKIIVAPVGASLANMIFCPPGCKLIVMAPYYQDASYFYYSNLSGALGHDLYYVLGPQKNTQLHPIHRNYYIDPNHLNETLKKAITREF